MLKVLLLLALVAIGIWMLTTKSRIARRRDKPVSGDNPADGGTGNDPQAMVRCAHCGLHLPAVDALSVGSESYCGEPHRRLGPQPPPKSTTEP